MNTLYVVATPIGNLEDITLRALRVLKEVDVVVCEDTRVTKKLLNAYEISKETVSYHSQSGEAKEEKILGMIRSGKTIALVSDAGTPTISDPGSKIVSLVREKLPETKIAVVPGASAVTAALSVAGVPVSDFLFLGFLPHKKGRETLFKEISQEERTVVFYESPHRIEKTLHSLSEHLSDRKSVTIARELTKMYEEVRKGSAADLISYFENNKEAIRGEFVVIVSGK